MNTNKTTYKTALDYAIDNLVDAPDDILEKLQNLKFQLEKKSTAERKPTKEQEANLATAIALADFLRENGEKTSAEIRTEFTPCIGMTPQKLVGICKRGVEEGILSKREEGRRTYYNAQ